MMSAAAAATAAAASTTKILDLLIIGGGLSGVFVAHDYEHRQSSSGSWKLLEARSVLGGRLANDLSHDNIDLGGAWVWPHHQPNMRHLLPQLGLTTFEQPDDPSSTRIEGGAVKIVEAVSKDLPKENILLNAPATKCSFIEVSNDNNGGSCSDESYIQVETKSNNNTQSTTTTFKAKRVVIAVPPKLISKHIAFDPPLSPAKQKVMEAHHTWMAGVTKIALLYPTAFWKQKDKDLRTNMGLPSHLGPAFQVYDASTKDGSVAAITFFALVKKRDANPKELAKQVANQLAQVWEYLDYDPEIVDTLKNGYTDVHVQQWPQEEYISEDSQPQQIHPHPHPVMALSTSEWDGRLLFAGSESDLESPGVMEGAIGAGLRVLQEIP